ncbi:MAG: fibronectin type III domain-containing protein, partial [Spirochaetaceae bacterium]|nr:fibronectin type III domain-containing protein [Spirochaetaceae bacterium]
MMNLKRVLLGTLIVSAAFLLIGCPDGSFLDGFGDPTGPIPGNDGMITIDSYGQTTVEISWTAAMDNTTAAADIEYQVYYATSDQLSTPENAIANGSAVFASFETARGSATLTGLIPGTQYWMVVVARDSDENMTAYMPTSATTISDTVEPTPGNGGVISVDAIDQTTIDISWTAASDDTTPSADIEYQVYYSTVDNIGNADDAANNGTPVFVNWTAATVTATITGLTRDTQYWMNVVARDAAANAAAYTTTNDSTALGPVIRLEEEGGSTINENDEIDY